MWRVGESMKVLIACEFSGIVRDAFIKNGHDAISCDLLPSEAPGPHIKDDVLGYLACDWDLLVAHPPCTYLCNSGVRWLYTEHGRWEKMENAASFFMELFNANIGKICIENPIPHKYTRLPKYDQIIQPWQFGHGETKATCLWLKNLPKLAATSIVDGRTQKIHLMSPSDDRSKNRSRTYTGIANAMAMQWGNG